MLDVLGGLLDTTKQWHMTVSGAILCFFLCLTKLIAGSNLSGEAKGTKPSE
jgi:hypothetical protein